jgi:hypothetical protein
MKKNGLTSAVIAGIAGVAGFGSIADAVNLNPDGLGQVLIYPYYTTQEGNDTLISVVNTADVAKAVKVRFLEGRNSREVLDFHLYLSAYDVWTGGIFSIPEGATGYPGAGVYTRDRSCTVPDIVTATADGQSIGDIGGTKYAVFVNWAYADLDPGPDGVERTREGYIEMIEMADIVGAAAGWVTHGASGVPANCAAAVGAWAPGGTGWPAAGQAAPNGQGALFGNAMIVNAARGTVAGYAADAIEGFNYGLLHFEPGNVEPNLNDVNDPGFDTTQATAYVFEFGQLITSTYPEVAAGGFGRVDAISALYATPRVINEYYLDGNDTVRGATEWVITFPTKRFYVDDNPYIIDVTGTVGVYNPDAPVAPFRNAFRAGGSCEGIRVRLFNREERTPAGGSVGFSPPRPGTPQNSLCWEAQVVTFGQGDNVTSNSPSSILGSTYFNNITPPFDAGWAQIEFGTAAGGSFTVPTMRPSLEGNVFRGLPVTGFFAANYDNGVSSADVLANYTALFRHRTVRDCVNGSTVCS